MILVENSPYTSSSAESDFAAISANSSPFENSHSDSPSTNDPFIDLEELDQLLALESEPKISNTTSAGSTQSIINGASYLAPASTSSTSSSSSSGNINLNLNTLNHDIEFYDSMHHNNENNYYKGSNSDDFDDIDADDEDDEFLEFDFDTSDESRSSHHEYVADVSALTPSVQRLFGCQTSMSNYSSSGASSTFSSIVDEVGTIRGLIDSVPESFATRKRPLNTAGSSVVHGGNVNSSSGGYGGGKTTLSFDIFGNAFESDNLIGHSINGKSCGGGGGGGSNASSTPSTPSSIIGAYCPSSASSSSSSSSSDQTVPIGVSSAAIAGDTTSSVETTVGAAAATLPSFAEIYSPRCKNRNHYLDNQRHNDPQHYHHLFDYSGDFFKFEDYISEGDSVSECDENSDALLSLSLSGSGGGGAANLEHSTSKSQNIAVRQQVSSTTSPHHSSSLSSSSTSVTSVLNRLVQPLILKEEPMDSFQPTDANLLMDTTIPAMQLKHTTCTSTTSSLELASITTSGSKPQQQQQPFCIDQTFAAQTMLAPKSFGDDHTDAMIAASHKITTKEELMFQAESPKPMRYHLHNLSLNVMQQSENDNNNNNINNNPDKNDADILEAVSFDDHTFDTIDTDPSEISRTASVGSGSNSITFDLPSDMISRQSVPLQQQPPLPPQVSQPHHMMTSSSSFNMTSTSSGIDNRNASESLALESNAQSTSDQAYHRSCVAAAAVAVSKSRNQRSKSMQMQICGVCGDVAACQHYGVLTCEGCKGFFKRTVQKGSKYTCLGNKDCTVDKRRRNRCQFCRFQKCLAVGMVKEVVRTDSLRGRRGRLPSKAKTPQEAALYQPMSMIQCLAKAHAETSTDKANLDFSQFNDTIPDNLGEFVNGQLLGLLNSSLDILYNFMEKIPGFNDLNEYDRNVLFQSSCLELFALRMAYRMKPGCSYIILCNNIVLHRNQFEHTFNGWISMIEELSNQLAALELEPNAFASLCALTVIADRHGLRDMTKIDQLVTRITNSLKDHTVYHAEAQKKPNYFSRILSQLPDLRTIGEYGYRVVTQRLRQLAAANIRTPDIEELEKKFRPIVGPPTSLQPPTDNVELASDPNLDLPSISSFFKVWRD